MSAARALCAYILSAASASCEARRLWNSQELGFVPSVPMKSGSSARPSAAAAVVRGQQLTAQMASTEAAESKLGYDVTPMPPAEVEERAKELTPFERRVSLEAATERAFSGKTTNGYAHDDKTPGYYVGAISGLPLFSTSTKYDSGTGWPSFWAPVDEKHVILREDPADKGNPLALLFGGTRVEVIDAVSGAHLGHVFSDGPRPTGQRFCMNAAALRFVPSPDGTVPEPDAAEARRSSEPKMLMRAPDELELAEQLRFRSTQDLQRADAALICMKEPLSEQEEKSVEEVTEQYGLEAGLFSAFKGGGDNKMSSMDQAKDLLTRYGGAYLLTSTSLAAVSFGLCYYAVDNGIPVASLLSKVGISVSADSTGETAGTVGIAYAIHKAASPIRFPPTVALTPVVAKKLFGKKDDDDGDNE